MSLSVLLTRDILTWHTHTSVHATSTQSQTWAYILAVLVPGNKVGCDVALREARCTTSSSSLSSSDLTCLMLSSDFCANFFFPHLNYLFWRSPFLFLSLLRCNLHWAVRNHRPSGRCREKMSPQLVRWPNPSWVDRNSCVRYILIYTHTYTIAPFNSYKSSQGRWLSSHLLTP